MEELLIVLAVIGVASYFVYQLILENPDTSRLIAFSAAGVVGFYAFLRLVIFVTRQAYKQQRRKRKRQEDAKRAHDDALRQVFSLAKYYGGTLTAAQLHAESYLGLEESRYYLEQTRTLGEAYTEPGERGVLIYVFPGLFPQRLEQATHDDAAKTRIYNLVQQLKGRTAASVHHKAVNVSKTIFEFLPRVHGVVSSDFELFTIKQVALDYFPTLLENYLQLTPSYAQNHPIAKGKTAEDVLEAHLDLLQTSTQAMLENVHQQDAQALLKTARFLADRFNRSDLTL